MEEKVKEKEYNFSLTLEEARAVVTALKKFPMEQVEGLVVKLDHQFSEQVKAENPPLPVQDVVETPKKIRKSKVA